EYVTSELYSAFRVRLLSQAQALPSLDLSRPFSHAGVYVHFLRCIWLVTCWCSTSLILKGNSLVFYFYAIKKCQWIFPLTAYIVEPKTASLCQIVLVTLLKSFNI